MGGHLQSSAWGMLSHSFGSGMDRVTGFRMVLSNGDVGVYSRNDSDPTVYTSVLGSAPGSWGVLTQFTLEGIHDLQAPFSRMIKVCIVWSKDNFIAAFRQAQFVCRDQEARNLRDMKLILITAPPTEAPDTEVFITVYALWTGIDSGPMTKEWKDRYLQPFWDIEHKAFPWTLDVPAPLSFATRLMINKWTNHNDRYAVQAFHSDYWWDMEFINLIAEEVAERVAMIPDVYPSFQFLPLGMNTQWARNAGMNSLTWRDARAYVDDWMFVKNESRYTEIETRMRNFREKTRKYWQYRDGSDRSTWMSPATTYPNATDLTIPSVARQFFPNQTQYEELRKVKAMLDPEDMFHNKGTIPLPATAQIIV
jgi:hypothetical protein